MDNGQNIAAGCVCVHGIGVLILGDSGSGKSSLALSLIQNGARLVSDDRTVVFNEDGCLWATAPISISGMMEVRGIGLVRGFEVAEKAPVRLLIRLKRQKEERLPVQVKENFMGQEVYSFSFYKNDFALTNKIMLAIRIALQELVLVPV